MAPLFVPLLALTAGILVSPYLEAKPVWLCLPPAVLVSLLRPRCSLLAVALLGAGLASLESPVPPAPDSMPVRLAGVLARPLEWRGPGVYIDVELLSIDGRPARGRARLTEFLDDAAERQLFDALDLGTGDRLEIVVRLNRPVVYRNQGVFDYRRHLERQGIYWTGTIRNPRLITVLGRGRHSIDRLKKRLEEKLETPFAGEPDVQGLVLGMVLGRKHRLTAETERQFQAGGLYHLVVVSGFNLAIVAAAAMWAARLTPLRRRARLLFVLASAVGYAAIVEGQAPVVRATLMVGFLVAGRLLDRGHAVLNAVAGSAFAILLFDPAAIEDSSFQMTFAAVLAIVCIGVPAARWMLGWLREALKDFDDASRDGNLPVGVADWRVSRRAWCELHGLPNGVLTMPWRVALLAGETAIVSLAVESVFIFFMVESFHRVSPVSPLLNVPAGIIAAAVTPLGLLLLAVPAWLAPLPAWAIGRLLGGLLSLLDAALELPAATLRVPSAPVWLWMLYAIAMAVLIAAVQRRRRLVCIGSVVAVAVLQAAVAAGRFPPEAPKDVTLTFLDVGQGDSTLVELPSGERMLIDGGGAAAGRFLALRDESTFSIGEHVVSSYLFSRRIRRLDRVVLTHAHHDHMDGLFDVIGNFEVGEFWLGRNPMIPRYRELIERLHARQIPIRWVSAGDSIGPFEVLHPPKDWRVRKTAQNDDSVVLLLHSPYGRALLTGDIERAIDLHGALGFGGPGRGTPLDVLLDVLKVPHHGSRGVRLRTPAKVRVISVGSNNPFGHPHESSLPALRTDRDGAITVTLGPSGPEVVTVVTRLTQTCRKCKIALPFGRH